jgi:hypothetical protein
LLDKRFIYLQSYLLIHVIVEPLDFATMAQNVLATKNSIT